MSTVQGIDSAIRQLSEVDLAKLRNGFAEFDEAAGDAQIADDATAGRLDAMADEARNDLREGRCTDL